MQSRFLHAEFKFRFHGSQSGKATAEDVEAILAQARQDEHHYSGV